MPCEAISGMREEPMTSRRERSGSEWERRELHIRGVEWPEVQVKRKSM
jgi:hypothetical protein